MIILPRYLLTAPFYISENRDLNRGGSLLKVRQIESARSISQDKILFTYSTVYIDNKKYLDISNYF